MNKQEWERLIRLADKYGLAPTAQVIAATRDVNKAFDLVVIEAKAKQREERLKRELAGLPVS